MSFAYYEAGFEQNLATTVANGDTLSVTFSLGVKNSTWGNADKRVNVYFKVGSTYYRQLINFTGQATGTWAQYSFTTTIANGGNLTLGFQNTNLNNSGFASVDNVSDVTWTPVVGDPNAPTSTGATLAALENTATPLAAGDFGYADPNLSPLAAVQITAVPTLGTLTYISTGTPVANNDIIAAADITNLSYLSPLHGFGNNYTTIGIKVQNSASLWSLPAAMTVNVTHVNHAPTSTGGAVTMSLRAGTSMTFAASNFQFSDVDTGNTLQAIKVTSLPTNGTLNVALDTEIPVADIGTLTYTPTTGYTGPDSFDFQVSDGALFSANATMAISVTTDILVQNGSFETPGGIINATYWRSLGSPWTAGASFGYEELDMRGWEGATFSSAADGFFAANMETWILSVTQDLNTPVNAGDTLSVTFSGGRAKGQVGGKFTATFVVGTTEYTSSEFDTALLANDTWQSYTFTTPIANTGNLSIVFRPVSGRPWLDKVSNVSVSTGPPAGSYAAWATTNGAGTQTMEQDHDNDGVPNGVEYFLGDTTGFTALPGVVNTTGTLSVTWIRAADYPGVYGAASDYVVQTSTTLATDSWTNEPETGGGVTVTGTEVKYTFPSVGPVKFARLKVMGP